MKKRIGNDISFIWHISRCEGGVTVPESFAGKDVVVELLSPTRATAQIEDVEITDGTVRFTFPGRNQTETGNYTAVLYENRGENGMVTLDVVRAVTLVAHSFQETEDEGGSITVESVEFESSISNGSGGDAPIDVYTRGEIDEKLRGKQNTLTAGENITIEGNVINSTSGGIRPVMWNDLAETDLTIEQVNGVPLYWNMGENLDTYYIPVQQSAAFINTGPITDSDRVSFSGKFRVFGVYYGNYVTGGTSIVKLWVYRYAANDTLSFVKAYYDRSIADIPQVFTDALNWNKPVTASDIAFDNSQTGLAATNVQNAIEEMMDSNIYEEVLVTVGSRDSAFNPVGQTLTVTLEDGTATMYTVPLSRQVGFHVVKGMRYTITLTSTADYRCLPKTVRAAIATRYIEVYYVPIATGVFILQRDGNYYLREEYDMAMIEDAVGVLVLTSGLIGEGFGIVLKKGEGMVNGQIVANDVQGTAGDKTTMAGYLRTQQYVASHGTGNLPGICWSRILAMDSVTLQGFMGTYPEYQALNNNTDELNQCLRLLSSGTWASTNGCLTLSKSASNGIYNVNGVNGLYNTGNGNTKVLYKITLS